MLQTKVPSLPLSGGCQCGGVRYKLLGRPLVFYLCHCTECQRQTSSAFGESLRVRRDDLHLEGPLKCTERQSVSGKTRQGWFCPDCGVRIYHGTKGSPEVNIKAGTLDDTSWLRPAGHIWTGSKQPFVRIDPAEMTYEAQPDDNYAALAEIWHAMSGEST